jgi:hypothetical protein
MRVNINGVWYDAEQVPIQIELTDADKSNISNMHPQAKNYFVFPDKMDWEKVKEILKIK